jgi:hypothetical protein
MFSRLSGARGFIRRALSNSAKSGGGGTRKSQPQQNAADIKSQLSKEDQEFADHFFRKRISRMEGAIEEMGAVVKVGPFGLYTIYEDGVMPSWTAFTLLFGGSFAAYLGASAYFHDEQAEAEKPAVIPSWAQFEYQMTSVIAKLPKDYYVLFYVYGEENPETGRSWCSDTVRADPVIKRAILEARAAGAKFKLVQLPVSREDYKERNDLPYKKHPWVQLKAIPQLVRLDGITKTPSGFLVEEECFNDENVVQFIRAGNQDPEIMKE